MTQQDQIDKIQGIMGNNKATPSAKKLDAMGQQEKIDSILLWAEDHSNFDTGFVDSMQDKMNLMGELTENMEDALDNIILRWKISS